MNTEYFSGLQAFVNTMGRTFEILNTTVITVRDVKLLKIYNYYILVLLKNRLRVQFIRLNT